MEKINVSELTDEQIDAYDDAFMVAHVLDREGVESCLEKIRGMDDEDKVREIESAIDEEKERRAMAQMDAMVESVLTHEDPAEAIGETRDKVRIMNHRAARLLRLIHLKAPTVIINGAYDLLTRTGRLEE